MRFIPNYTPFPSISDLCDMKTHPLILFLLISLWACKSNSVKEAVPEPQSSTSIEELADSPHTKMDTSIHAAPVVEKKETSKPHITDHICSPNFTLLSKPKSNVQIYYVSGFDHQEFKCWEVLQNHAVKLCNDQICTIYYVDKAEINVVPGAKDLMEPSELKEHGICRFTHDGKFWSLQGSSIWKRSGNGWSYFTTNNQFGG